MMQNRSSRTFRVLVIASGQVLTSLAIVASMALLARLLTKEDFAVYTQSILIFTTISPLLSLGLPRTLYVLLQEPETDAFNVLISNQFILVLMGGLFAGFLWFGGSRFISQVFDNADLIPALRVLAIYFVSAMPLLAFSSAMLVANKAVQATIFNVSSRLLLLFCIVLPAYFYQTPEAALWGLASGNSLVYIVGLGLMVQTYVGSGQWQLNQRNLMRQISLGLPLLVASSFGIIQANLDKWIVSTLGTPSEFIVFAVGAIEIPLIGFFTNAVIQVLLADLSKYFYNKEYTLITKVIWQTAKNNALVLLPTMIFLYATADLVIPLIFSAEYAGSVEPFRYYLLLIPARLLNFSSIEIAAGRTKLVPLVFGLNLILVIILSYILYPVYGYLGVIFANIGVTYLVALPIHFYLFRRVLKLQLWQSFPALEFLKIIAALTLASLVFLGQAWFPTQALLHVFSLGIVFAAVFVGGLLLLGVDLTNIKMILRRAS